jgi:hypothetical protein
MKIIYIIICITALLLFILGSFNIEYFTPTPGVTRGVTPQATLGVTPQTPQRVTPIQETKSPTTTTTPSLVPKFTPSGRTPRPIVVGQPEKDLIDLLTKDNVTILDKIDTKIAPQDFLEISAILEYLIRPNNIWIWRGPSISSIPTSTDIINDLNNLKVTTLDTVTEVRGISKVELSRFALLGKLVYLNGKWGWNYKTTLTPTQLTTDLDKSGIKSVNDVTSSLNTIVSPDTVKDMMNLRYLLFVDGKWIWNSTMDPKNYNKKPIKFFENGALVAIAAIVFLIILVIVVKFLMKD